MTKRITIVMLVLSMLFVSACSNSANQSGNSASNKGSTSSDTGNTNDSASNQAPAKITMFAHEWQNYDGVDKDRVWEEIERRTNTEITLLGAPYNGYIEKLNILVNTGDAPDVFFAMPGNNDAFLKWAEQGLIIPLDEYLTDEIAPNIKTIFSYDAYKYLRTNNKYTVVPWLSAANNWGIYIRQDWLDKVGLPMPITLDDYYNVIRAFTKDDPDGNNKNDTYGLTGSSGIHWFMPFYAAFVSKPDWNWTEDQSTIEYFYASKEYKEFLGWMSKVYSEGLIAKEWYQKQDNDKTNDFETGKAGILVHNAEAHIQAIVDNTLQAQPNAVVAMAEPPVGPSGKASMHGWGGHWGGYAISSNAKNPEAAMRLLDFLVSEEGTMLRMYGIEGTHYDIVDGEIMANVEERAKEPIGRFGLREVDGVELPLGEYAWGPWFGSNRTFEEDGIKVYSDFSTTKYPELAAASQDIVNKHVTSSDLNNITISDQEFADISSKVRDLAVTYTTLIIVGEKDLESGWQEYLTKLGEVKYARAQEIATDFINNLE